MPEAPKSVAHDWFTQPTVEMIGRTDDHAKWRRQHPSEVNANDETVDAACAQESAVLLPYVNARWFINKLLPTKQQQDELRADAAKVITSVLKGFQVSNFCSPQQQQQNL